MRFLYVTTVSGTINAFLVPHIKMLIKEGHSVDIACNVRKEIDNSLLEQGCEIYNIGFSRSPINIDNYKAYKDLKKLILDQDYDVIHTHTPIASALVRLACRKKKDTKVFYTAHGFHFHKKSPLKNWALYYPIEKWLSKYTDCLITINEEDYKRAKKSLKAMKVEYMPGVGFNIDKFKETKVNKKVKRIEIGVPINGFIVVSVGELNKNKNHQVIIRAIADLNNPNVHYIVCGDGPLIKILEELAEKLKINDQIHLLGRRIDIAEILKASDVFAFPSLREGLGIAALEAMACGLPIITSNIHGIVDYSINEITGYSCDPTDIDCFASSIARLFKDKKSCDVFSEYNQKIIYKYDIDSVILKLKEIYMDNIQI